MAGRPSDTRMGTLTDLASCPADGNFQTFSRHETMFPSEYPGDRDDLAKVSSYYADISGRRTLRERLREVLNHPYQPGELAHLPGLSAGPPGHRGNQLRHPAGAGFPQGRKTL